MTLLIHGPGARAATVTAGRRRGRRRRRRRRSGEGEELQLLREEGVEGVDVPRFVLVRRRGHDLRRVIYRGARPRMARDGPCGGPPRRGHDQAGIPGVGGRAGGRGQERPRRRRQRGLARQARAAPVVRDGVVAAAQEGVGPLPLLLAGVFPAGFGNGIGIGRARRSLI